MRGLRSSSDSEICDKKLAGPGIPGSSRGDNRKSDRQESRTIMNMRLLLLASITMGLLAGCGEPKQLAPSSATTPSGTETASPETPPESSAPPAAEAGTVPAEPTPPAAAKVEPPKNLAARKLAPERIKRGEEIYRKNCASCHGPNGEATPGWRTPGPDGRYPPPPLDGSAHAWHHSTETLEKMIQDGSVDGAMPAWKGKLTNQQIGDVIVWIKSLWPDEVYDIWHKEIENKPQPKQN
ncbi:Cytochrome c, mono-and diheme variants [Nitrosospira multiformis ATCC 25196]|uniref:Cytochrome c, mono-and diheme variants n=2 Tax=Nitrosospira multiformis (strain ATCC 25196 / NCIMB 11849 / C 71) TaxID=323848 RepID=A0A1H5WEV4_NITMU|nr:cytochrome c [Nitrosospira multiformis]SEF97992.1 Cytochrome c, mono-and diheme variants [Nitrosospira multiformis ATCC 25196]